MVMPVLILQRTSLKINSSEIKNHVRRRLEKWKNRDIDSLVEEIVTLQKRLQETQRKSIAPENISKRFARLLLEGKVNPAIHLLDEN